MAEDNNEPKTEGNEDINNIKSEFQRKYTNLEAQNKSLETKLDELSKISQELASRLGQAQSKQPGNTEKQSSNDMEDLMYSNPEEFVNRIHANVEQKLMSKVDQAQRAQEEKQSTLAQLIREYPELGDNDSELVKEAKQIINQLPKEQQESSLGYKTAVYEAATRLGIMAAKHRKKPKNEEDENFTLNDPAPSRGKISNDRVMEIAELFGLNVEDPKVKERLNNRTKRKDWNRYQ